MENNDKKEVVVDSNEPKSEITEQHIESFEEFDDKKMVKALNKKGKVTYKYKKHVDMSDKIVVTKEQLKGLQAQRSPIKHKSHKGLIAALSCLAIAGIASAITSSLIISNNKNQTEPVLVEHEITLQKTGDWKIEGPTKAKRGDIVKFNVTKTTNVEVNKIPDYLSVDSIHLSLTKDENIAELWSTGDITWDFAEDKTISLVLKDQITTDVTWDVGFYLNGGTTQEQSKLRQKIKDNCKITDVPNLTAPTDHKLGKWQISTDLGNTWVDFDINNDVITTSSIIKPVWNYSAVTQHTINFCVNNLAGETKKSGELSTVVENNTTWKDVPKPVIEKNSYKANGWYYIDSTNTVQILTDDIVLSFPNSTIITIFVQWVEDKGTISFTTKDDKLEYTTPPAESYKVESGTKLSEIARPTIKGKIDTVNQKVYYPNGVWLTKTSGKWVAVDDSIIFDSKTHLTIAPDWTAIEFGKEVTTTVTFDAGAGTFDGGVKTKTYTYKQTISAETTELGSKWSEVSKSQPTTITPPTDWEVVENQKWGITLTDDTLLFGKVVLKANYVPTETNMYYVQLVSGDNSDIAWTGTQYFTKEFIGKRISETSLTIGDLEFIKKTPKGASFKYSLNEDIVKPVQTDHILTGWQYFKDGSWIPFDGSDESIIYDNMYNKKLSELADSNGYIKIKPIFESIYETNTIVLISNKSEVYIDGGVNVVKISKGENRLCKIMENFTSTWKCIDGVTQYYPVGYTNMLNGDKLDYDSKITGSVVLKIHWANVAFSPSKSLVQNLSWNSHIQIGTDIQQCAWGGDIPTVGINIEWVCQMVEDGMDIEFLAQTFGYETADELIGLERNVQINGHNHIARLIGYNHDVIAEGDLEGTPAALTFELANVLSDVNNKKMSCLWNTTPINNYDYTNSTLRKNLCGEGTGTFKWCNPDDGSETTETRTALQMLTDSTTGTPALSTAIKKVNKKVATYNSSESKYEVKPEGYNDKLFLLTAKEMNLSNTYANPDEGTTYRYYDWYLKDKSEEEKAKGRKKKDTDGEYYHSYWLASPSTKGDTYAFRICGSSGILEDHYLGSYEYGVSFAFCI